MISISISSLVNQSLYPKMMKELLTRMQQLKCRASYSEYFPSYDLRNNPHLRNTAGKVLLDLWELCIELEIPELNFLVVRKDWGVPRGGVMGWYQDHFGTLAGYDEYCDLNAQLCELAFKHNLIDLVP